MLETVDFTTGEDCCSRVRRARFRRRGESPEDQGGDDSRAPFLHVSADSIGKGVGRAQRRSALTGSMRAAIQAGMALKTSVQTSATATTSKIQAGSSSYGMRSKP